MPRSRPASEARAAGAELARFLSSPISRGVDVPRGDGRPVLVLPGLFANDAYLFPLHTWLARIGDCPVISRIVFNAGCPDRLSKAAMAALLEEAPPNGPVAIIGHSRGGLLGWAIAAQLGARVSHLVLLGSPAPAVARAFRERGELPTRAAAPALVQANDLVRRLLTPDCNVPACGCDYVQALTRPPDPATRVLSIYAAGDPIVPSEACQAPGLRAIAVEGSHSGLAHNVAVLKAIAGELATGG